MMVEPFIPLSVLSLDLDEPGNGWAAGLADLGIRVHVDDIGRLAIARSDARKLFEKKREGEQRAREMTERNDARLEGERLARLPRGIPAGAIPAGMSPTEYLLMAGGEYNPRRRSMIEDALSGTDMVIRDIREEVQDA